MKRLEELTYNEEIEEGLKEYVKQEIGAAANQYYDVGKFLFTVTTFLIVATLTIRSTLGENYNSILLSLTIFAYSLYITMRLTVFTNYENEIEGTILENYYSKRKWMQKRLHQWGWSFVAGITILLIGLGYSTWQAENSSTPKTKIEDSMASIDRTLKELLQSPQVTLSKNCDEKDNLSTRFDSTSESLNALLFEQKNLIEKNFQRNDEHLNRHLSIIVARLKSVCSTHQ